MPDSKTDWELFGQFINGVAAASEMLSKAAQNGYLVEVVCLASNLIDAKLRLGIMLKRQIKDRNRKIHVPLLLQRKGDKPVSERAIYKEALAERVITFDQDERLNKLYNDRNRVIHRYIISDITTDFVFQIASDYEKLNGEVTAALYKVEEEQIDLGLGITVKGPKFEGPQAVEWLAEMTASKHGAPWLAGAIARK